MGTRTTGKQMKMNYKNTLDFIHEFVFIIDGTGDISYANKAALDATGINRKDISRYKIQQLISDPLKQNQATQDERISPNTYNGHYVDFHGLHDFITPVKSSVNPLEAKQDNFIVCLEDMTEISKLKSAIQTNKATDKLTRVATVDLLIDRINLAIHSAKRHRTLFGILTIHLNQLNSIHESLGQAYSNDLLRLAAERLKTVTRATDVIAYNPDNHHFLVLVTDLESRFTMKNAVEKILRIFSHQFNIRERKEKIDCSAGVALFPSHGDTANLLIRASGLALSIALKDQKSPYHIYGS